MGPELFWLQKNACAIEARFDVLLTDLHRGYRRTLVRLKPAPSVRPMYNWLELQKNACAIEAFAASFEPRVYRCYRRTLVRLKRSRRVRAVGLGYCYRRTLVRLKLSARLPLPAFPHVTEERLCD